MPLFLTPLLKAGKLEEARRASKVVFPAELGESVESHSGYFTVNDPSCGSNMFFWYFPAKVISAICTHYLSYNKNIKTTA